jgi:pyruvate formate lyase activating enzyme
MEIGGFQKFSVIDYPKKISCIVFLKGCNFRCDYCYNKQLVLPELIKEQETIPQQEIFEFLDLRKKMIDGVVITGGEPTIHNNELYDFIKKIKEKEYLVKLDTNGSNPKLLEKLIKDKLVDYVAMDIKQTFDKYSLFTQIPVENIQKSIDVLKQYKIDKEFRITLYPELTLEDFNTIISYVENEKIFVQDFVNKNTLKKIDATNTVYIDLDKHNSKYILR